MKAATRPMWLPGITPPVWLDGSLPCDYGYDPLGLGKNPTNLAFFREAELQNGRWAMLGVVGMLFVELVGLGNWRDAPNWAIYGGPATYFGVELPGANNVPLLAVFELLLFGMIEGLRKSEPEQEKRCYPGGAFDPMGYSEDAEKFEMMKKKELANGRLAMVASLGYFLQGNATKTGPVANLKSHLANPLVNNCGNNGVSVPAAGFNLPDFA